MNLFVPLFFVPLFRRLDQSAENDARAFVRVDRALGVPLDRQHKVIGGGSFKAFDDAVVGAAGYDPQTIANGIGGLVVGGIYREERTSDLRPRTLGLGP